jgi:hypothetical protein
MRVINGNNVNADVSFADSPSLDAFGRVRISNPVTIFDSQHQYDKQPRLWVEKAVGTASATHQADESAVDLTIGASSGDRMVRQTREYFRYQPGKSQQIKITTTFGAAQANTEKLVGYGDDSNGIFFGQDGGGPFVLLRSKTTGTVSDARKVYQADWSLDKMDGDGRSGITLDLSKSQICIMDIEWLGVGRVRVGFVTGGIIHYVHEFLNANSVTAPYMTTANLPVRYEIRNTAAAAASSTLKQICCEVESEGGQNNLAAFPFSVVREAVSIPQGSANKIIVFAARHKTTFNGIENRAKFTPTTYTVLPSGSGRIVTEAIYGIEPTAGAWTSAGAESIMEGSTDIGANFTDGLVVAGSVDPGGGNNKEGATSGGSISERLPFGLDVDGANPVVMALSAYALDSGMTADFILNWEEFR